jgi:hypothetical protein
MTTALWLAAVLCLGAAVGCSAPPQEHIAMMPRQPDVLLQLILPRGSEPIPPQVSTAEALFARAKADYEARRFSEAARGFLEAARALRLEGPDADGFAANRRFCYRNAASALSAAGDITGGREALAAAAREDPACADTLSQLQADLAPR